MSEWQGRRIGQYLIKERLGRGGMGVVYRAVDTALDRNVAVKMMVPAGDASVVAEQSARFLLEAKAAARIQSRHVAQVIQHGQTETGELFIVMELLEGRPLDKLLLRGRIEPVRAVRIARHIAKGMQAAHELGIVHRDLKPANVMLCALDGEDEVAKVLDFGVAKMTNDGTGGGLTQQGALLGTLPFMAPEQVNGLDVDGRTDVYSLGVILFRMLAGAPMFDVESLSDLVRHQTTTPAPRIAERAVGPVDVSEELEEVVLKCLEKDPARRFQSMRELDVALAAAMGDEPSVSGSRRRDIEETLPTGFHVGMLASPDAPTSASSERVAMANAPTVAGAGARLPMAADAADLEPTGRRRRALAIAAVAVVVISVGIGVVVAAASGRPVEPIALTPPPAPIEPAAAVIEPSAGAQLGAAPTASAPAASVPAESVPAESAPVESAPALLGDAAAQLEPAQAEVVVPAAPASAARPKPRPRPRPKTLPKTRPTGAEQPAEPTQPSGFVRVHTKEGE